jgi:hypothetical protein
VRRIQRREIEMLLDQLIDEPGQMLRREPLIQRRRQQHRLIWPVVAEHLPDSGHHLRGRFRGTILHDRHLDQPLLLDHDRPPSRTAVATLGAVDKHVGLTLSF